MKLIRSLLVGVLVAASLVTAIAQPANDNFANRTVISGASVSLNGTTALATHEAGEPLHAGNSGLKSAWYEWTPTLTASVTIIVSGNGYRTVLAAYSGNAVNNLGGALDTSIEPNFGDARIDFNAIAGVPYKIVVDARNNVAGGTFTFNLTQAVPVPTVNLTSPANNQSFTNPTTITLTATATPGGGTVTNVSFYRNGNTLIGIDTNSPYSIGWSNIAEGSYTITARATDTTGQTGTSAGRTITVLPFGYISYSLIGSNSNGGNSFWRYKDDGSDQGTAWRSWSFNDSSWASGPGQLGFGDGDEATVVASGPANAHYATYYFRQTFTADNAALITNLVARFLRDDGVVGYLNGVEVIRNNLPNGENYLTYVINAEDDGQTFISTNINPALLTNGVNVFAAEVHQTTTTSTDLSWYLELTGAGAGGNIPPTITITNPLANTLFKPGTNITISVNAGDSDGTVTNVAFYADFTKIGDDATPPFSFTWPNVLQGTYTLTAVATDNEGASRTSVGVPIIVNDFIITPVSLIPMGAVWKYFDQGVDLGTAWKEYAFDDSSWSSGPAELGYGDSSEGRPEATVVSFGPSSSSKYPTTYFRRAFVVTNAAAVTNLTLRLMRDDGAVIHINGTEIRRDNLPLPPAVIGYGTLAIDAIADSDEFAFVSSTETPSLNSGINIIAVEVHQNAVGSSDLSFDLELIANTLVGLTFTNHTAPYVQGQNPQGGTIVPALTAIQVNFNESVTGVNAADLLINGVPASGLTGAANVWTFTFPQPAFGPVNVTWAVAHGITDQDASPLPFNGAAASNIWSYTLLDNVAPVVQSQSPTAGSALTNLTSLTVNFSEPVTGVDAGDLLINGNPAVGLSGGPISYTFSFGPPGIGNVSVSWAPGHNIRDVSPSANAFDANGGGATWNYTIQNRVTLVAANAVYRYFKGFSEASSPTDAWRQINYNDSSWFTGAVPIYYGAYAGNTLLTDMINNYSTFYARRTFEIGSVSSLTNIALRWRCDDGFICYINGVEQYRSAPVGGASNNFVPYNSLAANNGASGTYATVPFGKGAFVTGTNVIAFHVLNTSLGSSDILLDVDLQADVLDNAFSAPSISVVTPASGDVLTLTSIQIAFSEGVQNVDAADLLINGVPATGFSGTSNLWTFTFPQPAYGPVAVTWAIGHGITDFDVPPKPLNGPASSFNYSLINPSAPTVIFQVPAASATVSNLVQVQVTFSEAVENVNASDLLVAGAPATGVSGGPATYVFTFPQPPYGNVPVSWAVAHGITDTEPAHNAFDAARPGASWTYNFIDLTPPTVVTQNPLAGLNVTNITQLSITFSEPVVGVNASDLLINNVPALGVSGGPTAFTFTFGQPNTSIVNVNWTPTHGITDNSPQLNAFNAVGAGATWQYFTPDNVPPVVSAIFPPPGATVRSLTEVEVTFSEPVVGVTAPALLVNNIPAQSVNGSSAGPYIFHFVQPVTGAVEILWANLNGITDLASPPNALGGGEWNYVLNPNAVFADKIVINEIMLQAPSFRTNDEWIELHNTDSVPFNLNGWRFSKGVSFTFPNVTIPAGGYLVVVADVDAFQIKYPAVLNFVGPWAGSLANNGENIQLETALGEKVNEVAYASEGDWATRIRGPLQSNHRGWIWRSPAGDGSGPAMELMNPAMPTKYGRNWRSSVATNGTPGSANSVATTNIPPLIVDLAHFPPVPRSTDPVVVTARILDERTNGLTVTLFYRNASTISPPPFSTITMFDDGAHNDGVAGDGFYAATVPAQANSTVIEFYVQAVDLENQTSTLPALARDENNIAVQSANALYQVDDTVYAFPQPLYKLIMTETERRERRIIETTDAQSNAQMNGSLITSDGTGTEVRYNIGIRERGAGSRGSVPANQRVNVPNDRRWKGIREFNLNTRYTDAQYAGYLLARKSGLDTEYARIVRVTINNTNNAGAGSPQFGCYIHVEAPDSDQASAHFPLDDGGNLYRCTRPNTDLRVLNPATPANYLSQGYIKSSNSGLNDYSDLTNLTYVLNLVPDSNYTAAVRATLNVEQWMLYFAVNSLLENSETALGTGTGDDYGLYRGEKDRRFIVMAHDWDTIFNRGDNAGNVSENIFVAAALPAISRFMHWPEFEPIYYATLRRLCQTTFAPGEIARTLDEGLSAYVPTATITAMKTFASNRVAYVLSQLPADPNALPVAATSISGTISTNAIFAASNVNYFITGSLTIASGATLTIQPGVTVQLASGANITVANGARLLAEGTAASPILFTRSGGANWGHIIINGGVGSPESRITHARIEFNATSTSTPAIDVAGGTAFLDYLTFANTASPYIHVDNASFVISHCEFPTITASFEPVHGNGAVKSGGRGLFYRNWFGKTTGYNDTIDFTGGNRPGSPIVQFIDNVFTGSQDDILDIDGTDVWVEGNIFIDSHRVGSPDSSSAVSGGNDPADNTSTNRTSEITIIGNIFYDVDQAATAKQFNFYTFLNNTVVHQTSAGYDDAGLGAALNFADEGIAAAAGSYMEGNIFYDIERLTRNVTNATPLAGAITFNNNLMPGSWFGPGTNNSNLDPMFKHVPTLPETVNFTNWAAAQIMRDWLSLQSGSPGVGTGPNGSDKGAGPFGASVSVNPGNTANDAILIVGVNRTGNSIPTAGFPNGSGYTHYKWRLDGGPWSSETPVASSINLPGFKSGAHRVDVSGKRDSGMYQDDPGWAELALPTSVFSRPAQAVRLNEILASNQTAVDHEGTHPDIIELYNPGATEVDLSGVRLTDDATNPDKFILPADTTIPANGYLVIYANNVDGTSGLHAGFGISKSGQSVYLFDTVDNGGVLIDSVTLGLQATDYSIGRIGADWTLCVPTAGAVNRPAATGLPQGLIINELLASELTAFEDDFVELYNPTPRPVALAGLFFTDNPPHWPDRSPIPALTYIEAGGYIAFHADGKQSKGADHLNFSLEAERGLVALLDLDYSVIDCVIYGPQSTDISQGRVINNIYDNNFFLTPTPGAPNPTSTSTNSGVVLNEILAANSTILEQDGSTPDWIEFYNLGGGSVDLGDYSVTDSALLPRKYIFAPGTIITANGYLRLRCDGSLPASATNTGFNIKAEGGNMYLFDKLANGGALLNAVTYGLQAVDFSISRFPNGTGPWTLSLPTPGASTIPASSASPASVKINEWMAAPVSGEDWFELWNPNNQPVAIGGYYTTDDLNNRTKSQIPALSYLGASTNGYQRFWADSSPASGANHANFKFSANGESIGFANPSGTLIDSITFGPQATDVSEGRFPDGTVTIVRFPVTPSPGEANYLLITNVVINEALTHTDPPLEDAIELRNLSGAPIDLSDWWLSDSKGALRKYRIPNGTTLPANGHVVFYEYQFNLDPLNNPTAFSLSSAKGDQIYLSIGDAGGNLTGFRTSVDFGASQNGVSVGRYVTSENKEQFVAMSGRSLGEDNPGSLAVFRTGTGLANPYPKVGPVVISRIMYHPPDIGTNDDTLNEYIELKNISGAPATLYDPLATTNTWRLRDAVDYDFPQGVSLAADASLVLVSFDPIINPAQLALFRNKYGLSASVPVYGPYLGKLANDNDKVELYKPDNPDAGFVPYVLADRVHYYDLFPWPQAADGSGYAIHRLSLTGFGNDPTNWFAAPALFGGDIDSDGDGMPDAYENHYAPTLNPNVNDANLDPDGDGMTSIQEYQAGTDPTQAGSALRIISIEPTGPTTVRLTFLAVSNRSYRIEFKNALTDPFWNTLTNIGSAPTNRLQFINTTSGIPTRYYRLELTGSGFASANGPDTDGDGMPDAWELAHGFNINSGADAGLDADGDSLSNLQEYWADTNPTNAASVLKLASIEALAGNQMRLTFSASSNKHYTVEFKNSFNDPVWSGLANVPPAPSNRTVQISTTVPPSGTRLFRLRAG